MDSSLYTVLAVKDAGRIEVGARGGACAATVVDGECAPSRHAGVARRPPPGHPTFGHILPGGRFRGARRQTHRALAGRTARQQLRTRTNLRREI